MKKRINFKALSEKLGGRSRSSVCRDIKNKGFPAPITLGRSVMWDEEEVENYLSQLAELPYDPKPVRGKGGRNANNEAKSPDTVVNENGETAVVSEIPINIRIDEYTEAFKKAMVRACLKAPTKIIADGMVHFDAPIGHPVTWYILDASHPTVGLFGCKEKHVSKSWPSKKKYDSLNDQEKEVFNEKLAALKMRRKVALHEKGATE